MSRTVSVVAHSHWDREWYAPFETYRQRLVEMLDGLLDLLESDAGLEHFHLDGQTAVVDDYLEIRPAAGPRVAALAAAGRLAVGPWYVLMDEFCVSAETVVRNLQLGLRRAAELGCEPVAGYLPDMFGHVSQMPQILRAAGLGHAVVWRGVPAAIRSSAFRWRSPDGSEVRAEYLPVGYTSGACLPRQPAALLRRVAAHEEEIAAFLGPDRPMLLMNGGDHQVPQPWLPDLLAEANRAGSRFRFRATSLAAHLAGAPSDGLPVWSGELRSGARAPILMGTLSHRVDVKQAAAVAESALEGTAEPLAVLWLPPDLWPGAQLDRAWLETVRNSAHDSVCGCSADEVVRAVLARYDTVGAICAGVVEAATGIAGVASCAPGTVVVNPSARDREGLVEIDLPGDATRAGTQPVTVTPAGAEERSGAGRDLARILAGLARDGWLGRSGRGVSARIGAERADGGLEVVIAADDTRPADPAMAVTMAEVWARAGAGADRPLSVRAERAASQRVLARVRVPGWGWTVVGPDGDGTAAAAPVTVRSEPGATVAGNGIISVRVDHRAGTFSLGSAGDGSRGPALAGGLGRIVEEGDGGDSYNFAPVPGDRPCDTPDRVDVATVEHGPLRAIVRVTRTYRWPAGLADPDRPDAGRAASGPAEVVVDIEVRAGEPAARVTVTLDHHQRDHRVRVVLALPERAATAEAGCAFATVVRGTPEGGPTEAPTATFPSRRFVAAGGLTVTHRGLLEYELVDEGRALALTLLRATGILARPALPTRPVVAGPALPLADSQLPGPRRFGFAVAVGHPDPWELADTVWTPLVTARSAGGGRLPVSGSRLRVHGAEVSALVRDAETGRVEMRVFNPTGRPTTVHVPGHAGALVDLRGRETGRWAGQFGLRPWALATARLDSAALDG